MPLSAEMPAPVSAARAAKLLHQPRVEIAAHDGSEGRCEQLASARTARDALMYSERSQLCHTRLVLEAVWPENRYKFLHERRAQSRY